MHYRLKATVLFIVILTGAGDISAAQARWPSGGTRHPSSLIARVARVADEHAILAFADLSQNSALDDAPPASRAMPIPVGAPPIGAWPTRPPHLPANSPNGASPALTASFRALEENYTSVPPNTDGAVGPNHLVTMLNTQVRIQTRQGATLSTVSLRAFWSKLPISAFVFDPRVLYDSGAGRWIATAAADEALPSSAVFVAVSQTADPTGQWNLYRIDVDPTNMVWADQPRVGFNGKWIVVQANLYNASNVFDHSAIYAFNKADLFAGGAGAYSLLTITGAGAAQVPAVTLDNSDVLYLLQTWNGNSGGQGYLSLYTLSGAIGSETLSGGAYVTTGQTWDNLPSVGWSDFAPQLGSPHRIHVGDSRIQSVVFRNGALWAAQTIFLPPGGAATRSAVQWWQISPAGAVLQLGRIDDPSGNLFYAYPSLAVNREGDALIGYGRFSATQYAGAGYALRCGTDPAGTLRADTVLKAGEAAYYETVGETLNRWGDYSQTMVDPANDFGLWTIQEYAYPPAPAFNRWSTWWGSVTPGACLPYQTYLPVTAH